MDNKNKVGGGGLFGAAQRFRERGIEKRSGERSAFFVDVLTVAVAFFFARRHFVFGAYPLATAFIAVLPSRVLLALLGAAVGALTLGRSGIVYAICSLVIVFIRIILSGGEGEDGESRLFCEPYVMRIFSASVGGALLGVANAFINGFSLSAVFAGVFGVLFSAATSLALYGLFSYNVTPDEILYGSRNLFSVRLGEGDRWARASFFVGVLAFLYLFGFSLSEYSLFSISAAYIFATGAALFAAKRFGATAAFAVGFCAALGASPTAAVGIALSGVGAGLLFPVGCGYGILGGGALLFLWTSYVGGMMELLSVLPEYAAASALFYPLVRSVRTELCESEGREVSEEAASMVESTLILRESDGEKMRELCDSLILAAGAIRSYGGGEPLGEALEYRRIAESVVSLFVPDPCEENIAAISERLYKKERIYPADIEKLFPTVTTAQEICDEISRLTLEYEESLGARRHIAAVGTEYEYICKLINNARGVGRADFVCDSALSERLSVTFGAAGFADGAISAYGERRKRIIGAGKDKDGSLISSPDLKRAIEKECGVLLGKFDLYRKGEMVLFEAVSQPIWRVEYATASDSSHPTEISGDTAAFFERDSVFYSLISDGMGSGRTAERTSRFTSELLSNLLTEKESLSTALRAANHLIRESGEECSATVDLFLFDLLTGEALFTKCGAAPSFLKREGSLFRIKSETAPIGLMKEVDSEQIKVEVRSGDYIIMLSDGVYLLPDDAVWLFEFLSRPATGGVREYAEAILAAAKRSSGIVDDITVSVLRVHKLIP